MERNNKTGISLVRMSLGSSGTVSETAIPIHGNISLSSGGLLGFGPRSVSKDGKMTLIVQPMDSAFMRPAVLDLATGKFQVVPLNYAGDFYSTEWDASGNVVAAAQPRESTIWGFRQQGK